MNFFNADTTKANLGNAAMLFDFVGVDSPYSGTERFYSTGDTLSRFRDPGMININTINDQLTWNAVYGVDTVDASAGSKYWDSVSASMRVVGFDKSTPASQFDVNLPTQFPKPFRPASSVSVIPNPNTGGPNPLGMEPVDAGLLRALTVGGVGGVAFPGETPLFDNQTRRILEVNPTIPNLGSVTVQSYSDESRNPYLRYQSCLLYTSPSPRD